MKNVLVSTLSAALILSAGSALAGEKKVKRDTTASVSHSQEASSTSDGVRTYKSGLTDHDIRRLFSDLDNRD